MQLWVPRLSAMYYTFAARVTGWLGLVLPCAAAELRAGAWVQAARPQPNHQVEASRYPDYLMARHPPTCWSVLTMGRGGCTSRSCHKDRWPSVTSRATQTPRPAWSRLLGRAMRRRPP